MLCCLALDDNDEDYSGAEEDTAADQDPVEVKEID